jgi:hypothetical protein
MKVRLGHVANSSSTSYNIKNISGEVKDIVDFAKETLSLVDLFMDDYRNSDDLDDYREQYISSAVTRLNNTKTRKKHHSRLSFELQPGEQIHFLFGDEDGDTIGNVCDYEMRHGGQTESFEWSFHKWVR